MDINLQQILVALVMLVPGFIATNIQRAFISRKFSSDFEWVVKSLLIALTVNAIMLFSVLIFIDPELLKLSTKDISDRMLTINGSSVGLYLLILYTASIIYGFITGKFPILQLRAILSKWGIISLGTDQSVWNRFLDKQRPPDKRSVWLKIKLDEKKTIFGQMKHSSEFISMDEAFEVYLSHVCSAGEDGSLTPLSMDGLYMRIKTDQPAEVYFRKVGWEPRTNLNEGGIIPQTGADLTDEHA